MDTNCMYTLTWPSLQTHINCEFIQYHYTTKNIALFIINKAELTKIPLDSLVMTVQDYDTYPEDPDYDHEKHLEYLKTLPIPPLTRSNAIQTPNSNPDQLIVWIRMNHVNVELMTDNELILKLEKEGEQRIRDLQLSGNMTMEALENTMKSGFDEFKAKTGRNMTYAEMRMAYG